MQELVIGTVEVSRMTTQRLNEVNVPQGPPPAIPSGSSPRLGGENP